MINSNFYINSNFAQKYLKKGKFFKKIFQKKLMIIIFPFLFSSLLKEKEFNTDIYIGGLVTSSSPPPLLLLLLFWIHIETSLVVLPMD